MTGNDQKTKQCSSTANRASNSKATSVAAATKHGNQKKKIQITCRNVTKAQEYQQPQKENRKRKNLTKMLTKKIKEENRKEIGNQKSLIILSATMS